MHYDSLKDNQNLAKLNKPKSPSKKLFAGFEFDSRKVWLNLVDNKNLSIPQKAKKKKGPKIFKPKKIRVISVISIHNSSNHTGGCTQTKSIKRKNCFPYESHSEI